MQKRFEDCQKYLFPTNIFVGSTGYINIMTLFSLVLM